MLRYGFILGLICIIAAGLLSGVNALTQPKIIAQSLSQEEKTLQEILPGAGRFVAIKDSEGTVLYYKAIDTLGQVIGLAFKAQGKGYSSSVETMVGIDLQGKISAIKILSHNETPGLGSRITEPGFTAQFNRKGVAELAQVEAITGATISSKAVMEAVQKKMEEVLSLFKDAG